LCRKSGTVVAAAVTEFLSVVRSLALERRATDKRMSPHVARDLALQSSFLSFLFFLFSHLKAINDDTLKKNYVNFHQFPPASFTNLTNI